MKESDDLAQATFANRVRGNGSMNETRTCRMGIIAAALSLFALSPYIPGFMALSAFQSSFGLLLKLLIMWGPPLTALILGILSVIRIRSSGGRMRGLPWACFAIAVAIPILALWTFFCILFRHGIAN